MFILICIIDHYWNVFTKIRSFYELGARYVLRKRAINESTTTTVWNNKKRFFFMVLKLLKKISFSPVKTEFIRSKYQFLQFVNKQKDGELNSIDDLSKVF